MNREELTQAIAFMGLDADYSHEQLKKNYRELALKYHPDRGEYTSEVLFLELVRYKTILELNLEEQEPFIEKAQTEPPQDEYQLYRQAKNIENDAIYQYFQKRSGEPMALDESINPDLKKLRYKLENSVRLYQQLLQNYPTTIWKQDVKDSLERIKVWWNE